MKLIDFLLKRQIVPSKAAARRLIQQGAIRIGVDKCYDPEHELKDYGFITVGRTHYAIKD